MLRELFPLSARLPKTCSSAIFSTEEGVGGKTLIFVSVTDTFSLDKIQVSNSHDFLCMCNTEQNIQPHDEKTAQYSFAKNSEIFIFRVFTFFYDTGHLLVECHLHLNTVKISLFPSLFSLRAFIRSEAPQYCQWLHFPASLLCS